eukprot:GHVT01075026.1.p2 GENE.GHVT01075026.1~~GHVT01075026.1.p2  ORF type:complete len:210 (-),score=30.64 GHVT01075026.1:2365-2994(-)
MSGSFLPPTLSLAICLFLLSRRLSMYPIFRLCWCAPVCGSGGLQDVVRCSFVFWQRAAGTEDANAFEATYKVAVVPCILVIEPRTGRALKRWASKEFCDSSTAQSKLIEFIEEYEKSKPRELSTLDSAAVSSPEHEAAQAHQQDSVGSSSSSASSSGRTANVLGGTLGGEEGSAESEQTTMAYSNMNATLADLARMRAERIGRQPQEGS